MSKRSITRRNQTNSKKSTGPVTASGKARSSQNSLSHGMYAKDARLPDEDLNAYLEHQQLIAADLKPDGAVQQELALQVSDNYWRMRRLRLLENLHTTQHLDQQFQILADLKAAAGHSLPPGSPAGSDASAAPPTPPKPESGFVPSLSTPAPESGFVPSLSTPAPQSFHYQSVEILGRQLQRVENSALKALKALKELQQAIHLSSQAESQTEENMREKILNELAYHRLQIRYHSVDAFSPYWSGAGMPGPDPAVNWEIPSYLEGRNLLTWRRTPQS